MKKLKLPPVPEEFQIPFFDGPYYKRFLRLLTTFLGLFVMLSCMTVLPILVFSLTGAIFGYGWSFDLVCSSWFIVLWSLSWSFFVFWVVCDTFYRRGLRDAAGSLDQEVTDNE